MLLAYLDFISSIARTPLMSFEITLLVTSVLVFSWSTAQNLVVACKHFLYPFGFDAYYDDAQKTISTGIVNTISTMTLLFFVAHTAIAGFVASETVLLDIATLLGSYTASLVYAIVITTSAVVLGKSIAFYRYG